MQERPMVRRFGRTEMGDYRIRRMEERDIESLAILYRQFWGVDSDCARMRNKFAELHANPNYAIFCATVNGSVVGSIMGIVCDELYGNFRPFLLVEDLIVDQEYRERGIGRALMAGLENFAKEHNCSQIQFITETDRQDAVAFYASLGFDTTKHVGFKRTLSTGGAADQGRPEP